MAKLRLVFLAFVNLCLAAQEPGAEELLDLKAVLDRPITSASKRLQRLKEAPADATVITGTELRNLGYRTLGQALEGILGFRTNRDRAYEGLGVRGLYVLGDQNTRVLFLLDGHPLNSPVEVGSSKAGEDFGFPLDFISRIEIIRGPASSLYGNSAFLGMVNVITRSPSESGEREMIFQASSNGGTSLDAQACGPLGNSQFSLTLSGFHRPGSRTHFPELSPDTFSAQMDREYRKSAYLRAVGPAWTFTGCAVDRTQHLPNAPFDSEIGSPSAWYENRLCFGELRLEPKLGPAETLLRLSADWNTFLAAYQYDGIRVPDYAGPFTERDPGRSYSAEAQVRWPVGPYFLTLGYESQWHTFQGKAGLPSTAVSTEVRHRIDNAYAQAEWKINKDLDLVAGLQQAGWEVYSAYRVSGSRTEYPRESLRGLTPRFNLIWRPTDLDIFKVLYGGGYRNPTIFERFYDDGDTFVANPDLRSERIQTLQAIWASTWPVGLRSQLSWMQSRWTRLIQAIPSEDGAQQFMNNGQPLLGKALEAEIQGNWAHWTFYAQAGLYDWTSQGITLPNVAKQQASLRVTRHWDSWTASAELRHLGSRQAEDITVPSSTHLRLAAQKQWGPLWTRCSIENLGTRRRDLVAADYDPIRQIPWDGISIRLSAGLRF